MEEGYTRKVEDINFLHDQRNERKMVIDVRDPSYEQRLVTSKQRKKGSGQAGLGPSEAEATAGSDSDDDSAEEVCGDPMRTPTTQ